MTVVRPAAVAGRFYPDDPVELRAEIGRYLQGAPSSNAAPKGIIAPHAGYVYSGPVAASAYKALANRRHEISRVVLIGPSHFVPVRGLAASSADTFETPLGRVPVDTSAIKELLVLPQVEINDAAHAREHSLEVHIPFLQEVLGSFQLVPLVVGEATPEEVAQVLELLWNGPETAIVISSDLSHFHDHAMATAIDGRTSKLIEGLRYEELRGDLCCGFKPISGLLFAARKRALSVRAVDLRNSGDTAGPRDRVVGYGAYVVG